MRWVGGWLPWWLPWWLAVARPGACAVEWSASGGAGRDAFHSIHCICLRPVTCRRQGTQSRLHQMFPNPKRQATTNGPMQFAAVRRPPSHANKGGAHKPALRVPVYSAHSTLPVLHSTRAPRRSGMTAMGDGRYGMENGFVQRLTVAPSRGATGNFSARRRSLRNAKRGGVGLSRFLPISCRRSSHEPGWPGDPWCRPLQKVQIVRRIADGPLKSLKPRCLRIWRSGLCCGPAAHASHGAPHKHQANCRLRSEQASRILLEIARD